MSDYLKKEIVCAVCGKVSEQIVCLSDYSFVNSDDILLDSRRPTDKMEKFDVQIQRCPHCHYVSDDLSSLLCSTTKKDVESDEYKKIATNVNQNKVAQNYILYAKLLYAAIKDDNATHLDVAEVYALLSWIFDDIKSIDNAVKARNNALKMYLDSLKDENMNQPYIMIADFYRRNGEFEKAIEYAKVGLTSLNKYNLKAKILSYEIYLSLHNDTNIHSLGEIKQEDK